MRSRPALLAATVLAVLATLAAGCRAGGADSAAPSGDATAATPTAAPRPVTPPRSPDAALPVTVTDMSGAEVTVADVSQIVSLTGSATGVIDSLGLFDNLVGVDQSAVWPPKAAQLSQIGYQRALAAEGVLALEPTLIIGADEAGPPEVIEQLRGSGVPTEIFAFDETLETPAATAQAMAEGAGPRTAFVYYRGPETILLGGAGAVSQTMIEAAGGVDAGADSGVQGTVSLTTEALTAASSATQAAPLWSAPEPRSRA